MPSKEQLLRRLQESVEPSATRWLEQAIEETAHGTQGPLLAAYTGMSRHLGLQTIAPPDANDSPGGWTAEDAGRLVLLLTRAGGSGDFAADAEACFEQGDTREQH